ncbi:endonuclease domain-containing protein [Aquamicrobium zhengzhouense]|uniref:endonuclease domain-containing protein n=1 Tax=Aquamicrobium zhengzhouense TaxID=2781738 RepID=UPI002D80F604|nr:DUF559 domain-containing protein [Aquamicrobium zhengzhouense]
MGVYLTPTSIKKTAISRARRLRCDMTDGEKRLWGELRQFRRWYGIHVRRQVPIGNFVADFAIHSHKLIIEIDGEHHFLAGRQLRDHARDAWLAAQGFRVLRFHTGELQELFDGCIEELLGALGLTPNRPETLQ